MEKEAEEIMIFAGSSSVDFVDKMCKYLGIERGVSKTSHFREGNTYVKIEENVRNKDIYLVQTIGLDANNSFVELLFWIDSFKRSSARSVTVIMPYFSYAKADKKDEPRVSIRARVCADCIEIAGADRVITIDLHSPQIQGFFKKPVDNLYAHPILCEFIKTRNIPDLVVVSPDAGFARNARRYASYLKVPVFICEKTRKDHSEQAEIRDLFGPVTIKNALIVDDFTITCGTLIETANVVKQKGAEKIYAMVTHALLDEKAIEAFNKSDICELIVTDTVANPLIVENKKITTVSVAPFFAEAVKIIEDKGSLSSLFELLPENLLKSCF
ncbi:MAG TPA: ribose-phosphate pyrophosphokinase [Bacteroidales bacterium]|nr:ribose-phosphate pyrophosphokinase [Bacteroidales bacterium]